MGSDVLPFEASRDFNQNSLVEGLDAKLKRSTDFATYNRLTVEMRNTTEGHITNVKDWVEVFNKADNAALKTQRDTQQWLPQNYGKRGNQYDQYGSNKRNRYSQDQEEEPYYPQYGSCNDPQCTNTNTQRDNEGQNRPPPKIYTIDEVSSMDVSKLCNGCGWPLEGARHAAACRHEGSPQFNHNKGVPYRESEVAKSVTRHLVALDKQLTPKKQKANQQQGQQNPSQGQASTPSQGQWRPNQTPHQGR